MVPAEVFERYAWSIFLLEPMTIRTLLHFLMGERRAILRIADSPQALWLGLLFVISAGLAREYDGADLRSEPQLLLLPLAASIAACTVLFAVIYAFALAKATNPPPLFQAYRAFLTLFWMTAPLAWLYAIPVEHFFTPVTATALNLGLLGVVSVWRVALMIRVVVVLFGAPVIPAVAMVLWFGSTAAIVALFIILDRMLVVMGGIRHTPSEEIVLSAGLTVGFVGLCAWPILTIVLLITAWLGSKHWPAVALTSVIKIDRSAWVVAIVAILVWALILPITQPAQARRHHAEALIARGEGTAAIRYLSQFHAADFPPGWEPVTREHALPLLEAIVAENPPPWVRALLVQNNLPHIRGYHDDSATVERIVTVLENLPGAKEYLAEHPFYNLDALPAHLRVRMKQLQGDKGDPPQAPAIDEDAGAT
jgi:hypothetical protein